MVYRYGREEDEVISGLSFMKEMIIDRVQVYPEYEGEETTKFQVIIPELSEVYYHSLQFVIFKETLVLFVCVSPGFSDLQ